VKTYQLKEYGTSLNSETY